MASAVAALDYYCCTKLVGFSRLIFVSRLLFIPVGAIGIHAAPLNSVASYVQVSSKQFLSSTVIVLGLMYSFHEETGNFLKHSVEMFGSHRRPVTAGQQPAKWKSYGANLTTLAFLPTLKLSFYGQTHFLKVEVGVAF